MYQQFNLSNPLYKFLAINTVVFLIAALLNVFGFLFNVDIGTFFIRLFAVPASLKKLLFHFWTPLTYMFFHLNFWHFFFNMLWLYFIGIIFLNYIEQQKFVAVYILGGFAGAFLYVLAFNIFPVFRNIVGFSYAYGASAAISAIVLAIAFYQPMLDVYLFGIFRIKLIWIAVFFVLYDLISIPTGNAGGHIAHLGGALFGFIFAQYLKKGIDITAWFSNIFQSKRKTKFKIKFNKNYDFDLRTSDDYEFNYKREQIRKEIDRILEKISKKGYDSLSKKEKEFLNRYKDLI